MDVTLHGQTLQFWGESVTELSVTESAECRAGDLANERAGDRDALIKIAQIAKK